jgi:hypothetical protein
VDKLAGIEHVMHPFLCLLCLVLDGFGGWN